MSNVIANFTYEVKDKSEEIIIVSARIEKKENLYYWYTSHLTKPQDSDLIGLYHPSKTESTFEGAKKWLNSYIDMMKRSKVVVLNTNY